MEVNSVGTYSVNAMCTNCGHKGKVSEKKGTVIPDKATCPICGCFTFVTQKYFGVNE